MIGINASASKSVGGGGGRLVVLDIDPSEVTRESFSNPDLRRPWVDTSSPVFAPGPILLTVRG
jgi:hypothetical protein